MSAILLVSAAPEAARSANSVSGSGCPVGRCARVPHGARTQVVMSNPQLWRCEVKGDRKDAVLLAVAAEASRKGSHKARS